MANVYSMDINVSSRIQFYVRADSEEEAYLAAARYIRSEEGETFFAQEAEQLAHVGLCSANLGSFVCKMSKSWPENMVNLDVSSDQRDATA